jgi:erythromycin esterase-like protein
MKPLTDTHMLEGVVMAGRPALDDVGWSFAAAGATDLGAALGQFLDALEERPRLLGLGEPMHGEEQFPLLRNEVLQQLVEREGYRSIAIESDCISALTVDAFVARGEGSLDETMATGFSPGFDTSDANRRLVGWLRQYNQGRASAERVGFYGFDAPIEMMYAASPRRSLTLLHHYLAAHLDAGLLPCPLATIDGLIGDDGRWTNPAAAMDPSQSIGADDAVKQLRLITDDLVAVLAAESPHLIAATSMADWRRAGLFGRTAAGLLRYHALMAHPDDSRVGRLLGLRDAMMADNLKAVIAQEVDRGPTLVFAHNRHLQRDRSTWQLAHLALEWWSAGAIVGAQLGPAYAFLAGDLGAAPGQGLDAPEPDTLEGVLSALTDDRCIVESRRLAARLRDTDTRLTLRTGTSSNHGYFALDPDQLDGNDGVLFINRIPADPNRP